MERYGHFANLDSRVSEEGDGAHDVGLVELPGTASTGGFSSAMDHSSLKK